MRAPTPFDAGLEVIRLAGQWSMMIAEANLVIWMRLCGFAGHWKVPPQENRRMVTEKTSAMRDAAFAAARAAALGHSPARVAHAALKPVRRRTRSNVKRLTRRGPGPKRR